MKRIQILAAMIWWVFLASKSAASSAEYALIIAVLLGPLLIGLDAYGQGVFALFDSLGNTLKSANNK